MIFRMPPVKSATASQFVTVFRQTGRIWFSSYCNAGSPDCGEGIRHDRRSVLFTAVTDAVEAQLVDSVEAPGKNVTGTSDMPVIKDQISIIKDVLPEVKTIGILYTSSEANSEIQAREAEAAAKELGLETVVATSSSTNDIPQVIDSVVGNVDAIYIPSDNGFASAMGTVKNAAVQNQLPVFCAVEAMIQEGGIATTAINYYELGKQTAAQAVKILEGGSASQMPVEFRRI